jgi:hypothetical protein
VAQSPRVIPKPLRVNPTGDPFQGRPAGYPEHRQSPLASQTIQEPFEPNPRLLGIAAPEPVDDPVDPASNRLGTPRVTTIPIRDQSVVI